MQWGGRMNEHTKMMHVMIERNLVSYGNAMWRFRSDNFPDGYVKYLKTLRRNLKKTIEYLDELIKEVQ
jgi:hypothetical protein